MDQGRRPVPPPSHEGEPPLVQPPRDLALSSMVTGSAFVLASAGGGGLIWLIDGDLAQSLIAGGVLGMVYLLALLVQSIRGI